MHELSHIIIFPNGKTRRIGSRRFRRTSGPNVSSFLSLPLDPMNSGYGVLDVCRRNLEKKLKKTFIEHVEIQPVPTR